MLRTALRPRWLALLALALALASAFAWLGTWQLDRSRAQAPQGGVAVGGAPATVPLEQVLGPQESLTGEAARSTVEVTGTLEPDRVVLVADRELDGRSGRWLAAPLLVPPAGDDGPARLPVVLGWLPDGQSAPAGSALPTGEVTMTGRLQISEAPVGLPAEGQPLQALSSADLVNDWGAPLFAAYLLPDEAVAGLSPVRPPEPAGEGFALQNLSYAVQWWVFAAFAVFLWWRVVRDAYLDQQQSDTPDRTPTPAPELTRSATP